MGERTHNIIENINAIGKDLSSHGVNNYAFSLENALSVIKKIEGLEILILGGDVVYFSNERLKYAYDNWSMDLNPNNPLKEECSRSHKRALDYISSYSNTQIMPYFVFIFDYEDDQKETSIQQKIRNNIIE